jgi:carboxyl-terminal processing protease
MRNMLRSWHRGWFAAVLAAVVLLGVAPSLTAQDDLRAQLDIFGQVLSQVRTQYVDPIDNEKLIKGAIDGMLATLDPHSVYMPAER